MGTTIRFMAGLLCLLLLHAGPGSAAPETMERDGNQRSREIPDGAELYQANCAGCHGSLSSSNKRGRSAAQIQNAIKGNIGGMGFLGKLSPSEVNAISTALR